VETAKKAPPVPVRPASPSDNAQVAAVVNPRLTDAALMGNWCAGSIKIRLTPNEWRFQLPDGNETKLAISQYRVADDKILVYSSDNRDRQSVTEFGGFSGDQMTQLRGRLVGADAWNSYNRVFKKC